MTDLDALKMLIEESGMTMVAISEKSNIPRGTLYNRFKGIGDFTASEISGLTYALHMSKPVRDRIFFP